MATVLFEGVFDQILLKMAKNDLFQLCTSPSPTFLGQLDFFNFAFFCLSKLDYQKFG